MTALPSERRPRTLLLALAVALLVWWAASLVVPALLLPDPLAVGRRLVDQVRLGIAGHYLLPTILPALGGLLAAVIVALALAIAVTRSRLLAALAEPAIALSQTVPAVAIAPILVLWMGYGSLPIAVLCAIIAFFPMATTMIVGLRSLDPTVLEHAVLDGASGLRLLVHVELPMALPAILAGIRAGSVLGMTGAVVGEFVMGGEGLGTLLTLSRQTSDTVGVFTVIAWIAGVSMALHLLLTIAMDRAARRL